MRMIKIALATAAALSVAPPAAFAQYQPTDQYRQDLRRYDNDRADYDAARRDYEARRAQWERQRGTYDRRWGSGAYERRYGPPPAWSAGDYGRDTSYFSSDPSCRNRRDTNAVAGGLIGALIGGALGSNIAARNARTEGAVLGALVGGGVGVGVGRSSALCDDRGYYYSYDQTIPYREGAYDRARRSGRYDYSYYNNQRCRLAPAPVSGDEYRYVRVCPDRDGRYRITG